MDLILGILNFLNVSSLYLGGGEKQDPPFLIASTVISTLAGIVLVIQKSIGCREKALQSKVAAKEYTSLLRDMNLKLSSENLIRQDYIQLIAEINSRLSFIEDHSPILSFEDLVLVDELFKLKNGNGNGISNNVHIGDLHDAKIHAGDGVPDYKSLLIKESDDKRGSK